MALKVIITGTTGMVGEGVLLECLAHPEVKAVLSVSRKPSGFNHPKLKELVVPDFLQLDSVKENLGGYDACFYCAGISAVGLKEAAYKHITYDTTMHFANTLVSLHPGMVFCYVSGQMTDSTEKGKLMWARVKGKTENDLMQLPFTRVYNFRPGLMKPTEGQKNIKGVYKLAGGLYNVLRVIFPNAASTMKEVGLAMINCVRTGYQKQILEVKDIKLIAKA